MLLVAKKKQKTSCCQTGENTLLVEKKEKTVQRWKWKERERKDRWKELSLQVSESLPGFLDLSVIGESLNSQVDFLKWTKLMDEHQRLEEWRWAHSRRFDLWVLERKNTLRAQF